MSNGEKWQRLPRAREAERARLNKTLLIVLAIGVALTVLWIVLKLAPPWWVFAVGYALASAAWYSVSYMLLMPLVPPWFRLRNMRGDREAHLVRVLLEQEQPIDNPPTPTPLQSGDTHEQELEQAQSTRWVEVAVECQPVGGGTPEELLGRLNLPPGATANPFMSVDSTLLPEGQMFIEVFWMQEGWPVYYAEIV